MPPAPRGVGAGPGGGVRQLRAQRGEVAGDALGRHGGGGRLRRQAEARHVLADGQLQRHRVTHNAARAKKEDLDEINDLARRPDYEEVVKDALGDNPSEEGKRVRQLLLRVLGSFSAFLYQQKLSYPSLYRVARWLRKLLGLSARRCEQLLCLFARFPPLYGCFHCSARTPSCSPHAGISSARKPW